MIVCLFLETFCLCPISNFLLSLNIIRKFRSTVYTVKVIHKLWLLQLCISIELGIQLQLHFFKLLCEAIQLWLYYLSIVTIRFLAIAQFRPSMQNIDAFEIWLLLIPHLMKYLCQWQRGSKIILSFIHAAARPEHHSALDFT